MEHFLELRRCVIRILVVFVVVFALSTMGADAILAWLLQPLRSGLGLEDSVVYTNVLDKVIIVFQVSTWLAILTCLPYIIFAIWSFVKPGLYPREIYFIKRLCLFGGVLFYIGIFIGRYVFIPFAIELFTNFGLNNVKPMISVIDYISLAAQIMFLSGAIFEIPLVLVLVSYWEIITVQTMRRERPNIYVGLAILSAVITPADVLSMLMMWLPLIGLYELGVGLATWLKHYAQSAH